MSPSTLVLLVEDEPLLAEVAEEALIDAGYDVVKAYTAGAALELFAAHLERLARLITDIRLGSDVDGWAVARQARERKADVAVVYMTGDSATDWAANGVPKSLLIQKPFAAAQLVAAISKLLIESDSSLHS